MAIGNAKMAKQNDTPCQNHLRLCEKKIRCISPYSGVIDALVPSTEMRSAIIFILNSAAAARNIGALMLIGVTVKAMNQCTGAAKCLSTIPVPNGLKASGSRRVVSGSSGCRLPEAAFGQEQSLELRLDLGYC